MRVRVSALAVVAALAVGAVVSGGRAATRVVGGTAVQVQNAPWAVYIRQRSGSTVATCSGSILDPLHVLTAAHCVFDESGSQASIATLQVRTGISNAATPLSTDAEQDRGVSSIRVHPGFVWSTSAVPDDVAVVALDAPLVFGPGVGAATLPAPGTAFPAGAQVGLAGFGREAATTQPDGSLNWFAGTIDEQGTCGDGASTVAANDNAIAFCAGTPSSALCSGDSGGGLVTADPTHTLLGVASAGRPGCPAGSHGIFTSVGSTEILRFIQGDDHPPTAPRVTDATTIKLSWDGRLGVGNELSCASSGWVGQPTLAYAFVNAATGAVLQQSARPTFELGPQTRGTTIFCRALATSPGGTATIRTETTGAVGAAAKLTVGTTGPLTGTRGRTLTVRVVLHVGEGLRGKFGVCLTPAANVSHRVCASQRVTDGSFGGFRFALALPIKATAPAGTSRLAISAVAGIATAHAVARVRVTRA